VRIRAFVAAAALVPSLANAAEPIRIAPSSPWVVDYAENSCRLIRHFGQGKASVIFALESEAPGALDMLISGKPLATSLQEVPAKFVPLQTKPMLGEGGRSTDNGDPLVLWSKNVRLLPDDAIAAEEKRDAEGRLDPLRVSFFSASPRDRPGLFLTAARRRRRRGRRGGWSRSAPGAG